MYGIRSIRDIQLTITKKLVYIRSLFFILLMFAKIILSVERKQ